MSGTGLWGFDVASLRADLDRVGLQLRNISTSSLHLPALVTDAANIVNSMQVVLAALGRWTPNAQSAANVRSRGETQIVVMLSGLERAWREFLYQQLTPQGVDLVKELMASPVPDFLSLLQRQNDELAHSQVLTFFLDPRTAPSLAGDTLLGLFSEIPDLNGVRDAMKTAAREGAMVARREVPIEVDGRKGFVDVLITSASFAVAIENKVYSNEHSRQTEHYAEWMRRNYVRNGGIMLSPAGSAPLAANFRGVSYLRFVACLCRAALKNGLLESERMMMASYLKTLRNSMLRSELGLLMQGKP